ncbi:zinc finger, CCHC-type containing protein [Tanacetum coccineum]
MITPYELWTKRKPNLNYLRVWGCRAIIRLIDPKLKTLSERGIECIFVGYAENSKAFRFYVIEPNDSVSINSIIESRDAIFDENRFSSVLRPSLRILNGTEDITGSVKEAVNDEMDSIMGNNTWVLADLPPGCKPLGCKWIFIRKLKVDGTVEKFKARLVDLKKEFLSSRFSMKDIGEADVILVSTPTNTCEKLMTNNGQAVSQLEYSRVIGCLMYAMTCTRPGIAFVVGKLSRYTSNPGTQHLQAIQRASKKQTCITGSTMEYEFVALATACKEAEYTVTLAKAYSQMYNGKSKHLGVRHIMICELIMNGVVSIEFVRSQQNLADHLTKGLARDLVIKSAEGMGLKSN